ncbi:MAG: hypothetical protein ACWGQW_04195 [bacterium]
MMKLENFITPDEDQEITYLLERYRRLDTDKAWADYVRYIDSLKRKYKVTK